MRPTLRQVERAGRRATVEYLPAGLLLAGLLGLWEAWVRVFVAVAVIAVVSVALFAAVHVAARLATPWMYVNKEENR